MRLNHRRSAALVALAASLVAVSACSSGDDDATSDTAAATTEAPASTEAAGTDTTEAGATDTTAGTDSSAPGTTAGGSSGTSDSGLPLASERLLPPGESHVEDEGEPVRGGTLSYGIEADTANGWAPFKTSYATAGYVLLTSVSDPLFTATDEGDIAPVLVESFEHSDDYMTWTMNIREGISFTDGTPLDAAAVKFNMDTCKYSTLTGAAYTWLDSVEASGQTVTLNMTEPYVAVPRQYTERQCGFMMSPEWLGSLADVPQRTEGSPIYDAELAATPGDGDQQKPIGVGAFTLESYTPGNGNAFNLVRNEDYWRGDGPNSVTGEGLPYLDAIEGVVAVDIDSRSNSLRSGEFDVIHTSNGDTISQFQDDDEFEVIASSLFGDTNYIMLNVAEGEADPDGANAASPLLNVHCRRALAFATDVERLIEERSAGLTLPANGPFGPGVLGYMDDSGYPTYDPDQANTEFETCLSDLGTDSIEITYNTTNDPFNVETNTLISSMWNEVLGGRVNAKITPVEQGQYIGLALTGAFNAFAWRNHGGIDPATQAYWWQSTSSAPIGSLALNFGRFMDDDIDAALQALKTEADPAARTAAAEKVNQVFGEQVYNIWTDWALWGVVENPYVNGLESNVLPDGGEGVGLAFSGRHQMNQIWCEGGECE